MEYKKCENSNCSADNKLEAKFCTKCGTPFASLDVKTIHNKQEATPSHSQEGQEHPKRSKPLFKNPLFIGLIGILLSAILLYLVGASVYNDEEVFDAMEEAATSKNMDTLYNTIEIPEGVNYSEKSYKEYLASVPLGQIAGSLKKQVSMLKDDKAESISVPDTMGYTLFYLTKEKHLGIYTTYKLTAVPYDFFISANLNDVEGKVADQTFKLSSSDQPEFVGGFLHGNYDISATIPSDYGVFEYSSKISHPAETTSEGYIIPFEYAEANVISDFPDAEVYINEKATGQKIGELDEPLIVPVGQKVMLSAQYKEDNKEFTSNKYDLAEGGEIMVEFPEYQAYADSKDLEFNIKEDFIPSFRTAYKQALDYADFSYVENFFVPDSEVYKEYKKFVNDHQKLESYQYDFEENEIIDYKNLDNQSGEVTTFEYFLTHQKTMVLTSMSVKKYTLLFMMNP